jgi:hypothetical protein
MHYVADRASGVTLAKDLGDLTIGHYSARWYPPNDLIDAFAITLFVSKPHMSPLDQHGSRRRTVAFAADVFERQTDQFVVAGFDRSKVETLENDDLL